MSEVIRALETTSLSSRTEKWELPSGALSEGAAVRGDFLEKYSRGSLTHWQNVAQECNTTRGGCRITNTEHVFVAVSGIATRAHTVPACPSRSPNIALQHGAFL